MFVAQEVRFTLCLRYLLQGWYVMQLAIIAAIFVAIVGVIFAVENNIPVNVTFLSWQFDSSLAMVLLLTLALGAIIVALLSTPSTLRRQWLVSRQKKQIESLEKIVEQQRVRIAEFEKIVPVDVEDVSPPADYVGLKTLAMSGNDGVKGRE